MSRGIYPNGEFYMKRLIVSFVFLCCINSSAYSQVLNEIRCCEYKYVQPVYYPIVSTGYYMSPVVSYTPIQYSYVAGYGVVYPYSYNTYSGNWPIINYHQPLVPVINYPRRYFNNYSHYYSY